MTSKKYPHPFGQVAKRYRKFRRELTTVASNIALNEFEGNFGRNGSGGYRDDAGKFVAWEPRKVETTRTGRRVKTSRRSILVRSGRLKRSFKRTPTFTKARVINTAPYASIHNEGGLIKGTVTVREHTRKGGSKVRQHTRKVNTEMPKRPFMEGNKAINDEINSHINNELEDIFKDLP